MADIKKSIEMAARDYYNSYDDDTLFKMLVEEWQRAEPEGVSTHGDLADYLKNVVQRIAKGVVRNQDTISCTMGVITAEVLQFVAASGYDLGVYRVPIAVMVSVVAKAVVRSIPVKDIP
jgi:hypothetical protein